MDGKAWRRAVDRAVREPGRWVVQRFHSGTKRNFPAVGKGHSAADCYVTYGVISAPTGQGILGRASGIPVVNVSRGGGLVALFRRR